MKLFIRFTILIAAVSLSFSGLSQKSTSNDKRKLILRDEGLSQLSYVDLEHPENNWITAIPVGRDLQLVGNGLVMIGTGTGYEEREIKTGKKVNEITAFPGTIAARRLRNGNTLLSGLDLVGKKGMVSLIEIDSKGVTHRIISFPKLNYVRLVRETPSGNFLVTSDSVAFETDDASNIKWEAKIVCKRRPHSWQATRLGDGKTIVSGGFAANFQIFDKDGKPLQSITGPTETNPYFFSGYQVMSNGNYVVANWQGHGPGHGASGVQILEFTPKGEVVWSWKPDATKYSSIQGVLVLDGLNLKKLQVEGSNGSLESVK